MIIALMNWWDAVWFRRKHGYWCDHPAAFRRDNLIDLGRGKVAWCDKCGKTTLTWR